MPSSSASDSLPTGAAWLRRSPRQPAALLAVLVVALAAGCSTGRPPTAPPPTAPPSAGYQDRPVTPAAEPGEAPEPTRAPAGRVTVLPPGSNPWGVAADPVTGLVLTALRSPARLAAYDTDTREVTVQPAPGTARMIDLARPGGPLLYPAEDRDTLSRIALPSLRVANQTPAGRGPHQAVSVGASTFVTDEFGQTVRALRGERTVATFPEPVQPGGITAVGDRVAAVDVARNTLLVYDATTLSLVAALPAGAGPSHVVPIGGSRVAVSDVRDNAVRTYDLAGNPRALGRIDVPGRAFWIEADPATGTVYTALSNTNMLAQLRVRPDGSLQELATVPTVQQPNSFDLDTSTGTVYVAGFADSRLQVIPPTAFTP